MQGEKREERAKERREGRVDFVEKREDWVKIREKGKIAWERGRVREGENMKRGGVKVGEKGEE